MLMDIDKPFTEKFWYDLVEIANRCSWVQVPNAQASQSRAFGIISIELL